jgi:ATP synthase F1 complex assembly factor 1
MANPVCSTILFTPLQEYKLRQSFAQPYLVLTLYTDLAATHGIVLLRGELTRSPSSQDKFLLSQIDAQLLTANLQRFYLAGEEASSMERAKLLRNFHEKADIFCWKDLLKYTDPIA